MEFANVACSKGCYEMRLRKQLAIAVLVLASLVLAPFALAEPQGTPDEPTAIDWIQEKIGEFIETLDEFLEIDTEADPDLPQAGPVGDPIG